MKGPFFLLFQTFHVKMHNKKPENRSFQTNCGGGEGNRTPVRKHAHTVFSERIHGFGIPLAARPMAGLRLR